MFSKQSWLYGLTHRSTFLVKLITSCWRWLLVLPVGSFLLASALSLLSSSLFSSNLSISLAAYCIWCSGFFHFHVSFSSIPMLDFIIFYLPQVNVELCLYVYKFCLSIFIPVSELFLRKTFVLKIVFAKYPTLCLYRAG